MIATAFMFNIFCAAWEILKYYQSMFSETNTALGTLEKTCIHHSLSLLLWINITFAFSWPLETSHWKGSHCLNTGALQWKVGRWWVQVYFSPPKAPATLKETYYHWFVAYTVTFWPGSKCVWFADWSQQVFCYCWAFAMCIWANSIFLCSFSPKKENNKRKKHE